MRFTPNQIETIRQLIEQQSVVFIATSLGPDFLSDYERKLLRSYGLDVNKIYQQYTDPILQNFHFGILSSILPDQKAKKVRFKDVVDFIQSGNHLPLNEYERAVVDSIKGQSLKDIKDLNGRIFNDINGIIAQEHRNDRHYYEEVIRKEMQEGIVNRETAAEIVQALGNKTGDWSRQWGRMVEYISHSAINEGRAAVYKRRSKDNDPLVYKTVFEHACKHCIKAYLTNGIGSAPKIFRLSELEANGTNIGRKQVDWKPVVESHHPFCRCLLHHLEEGMEWSDEKKDFVWPEDYEYKPKVKRKSKVKLIFDGEEYEV